MRRFSAMCSIAFWFSLLAALSFVGPCVSARAAFSTSGDISPTTDPSTWSSTTTAYIGNTSAGTLTVDSGSLSCYYGYIGYGSTATGLVNIAGTNSTWTNAHGLDVGEFSSGTLNITNGGAVSSGDYGSCIGRYTGSTGVVTVDGAGTTWTNSDGLVVGGGGTGRLNIANGGAVSNTFSYIGIYSNLTFCSRG